MTYKYFNCWKNLKKDNPKSPDYNLSASYKDENDEYVNVDIGGGWIKEAKNGKYISFKLKDANGQYKGFKIVEEDADEKDVDLAGF